MEFPVVSCFAHFLFLLVISKFKCCKFKAVLNKAEKVKIYFKKTKQENKVITVHFKQRPFIRILSGKTFKTPLRADR